VSGQFAEKDALPAPCRFGYEEHDGGRYCFEHGGFLEAGVKSRMCARAWGCPLSRPEKRVGALRWHVDLHGSGRVSLRETDESEDE
jgi:hypothetical protein